MWISRKDIKKLFLELDAIKEDLAHLREKQRLRDVFRGRDVVLAAWQSANATAGAYWRKNLYGKGGYEIRDHLIAYAMDAVGVQGLWLEFGVADCGSLNWMAERRPAETFHGFDSFEGLPEAWVCNPVGSFSRDGAVPLSRENVVLHPGWFNDTVPAFFAENSEPIAFAHMDADLYSSTRTVFDACWDRLQPGTIIVFDEYFNYPGWEEHEFKAWQEIVTAHGIGYEYLGFVACGEQVAVRITHAAKTAAQPHGAAEVASSSADAT